MFMTEGLKNNPAKNIQIRFRKDFSIFCEHGNKLEKDFLSGDLL